MIILCNTTDETPSFTVLQGDTTDAITVLCKNSTNSTEALEEARSFDAFLYIVIVLSFYALSMTLLMVKYIRREEEEMAYEFYYDEFVKREHFANPSRDLTYKRMIEARIRIMEERKSQSSNSEAAREENISSAENGTIRTPTDTVKSAPSGDISAERKALIPGNGRSHTEFFIETTV